MGESHIEKVDWTQESSKESDDYQCYLGLNGIINETDFKDARLRAESLAMPSKKDIQEVENIARFAGIELYNTEDSADKRVVLYSILYSILRGDAKPKEVAHHHAQMGDIKLFAEVLRMTGDIFALNQMMDTWHRKGRVGDMCPICERPITPGERCR